MILLLEMMKLLLFGKRCECQKIEFLIFEKKIIGGQLEILDLVDQILKFFTGFENLNFHQKVQMYEMMKIIGWKSGIMYLWNTIDKLMELWKNYLLKM
jgi:hypothetical protein